MGRASPHLLHRGPSWVRDQAVVRGTRLQQQRLLHRLSLFCQDRGLPVTYLSAQSFIYAIGQVYRPTTILTYARHVETALWRRGLQKDAQWTDFMNGLRRLFAQGDRRKARPLPFPPPEPLLRALTPHQRWLLYLCYATACRLGDLDHVRATDVCLLPPPAQQGISVRLPITKEDRLGRKPPVVLMAPLPLPVLAPTASLMTGRDKRAISAALKAHGYSGHSIRRGALQRALLLTSDIEKVKTLARHARLSTTVEYLEGLPQSKISPELWALSQRLIGLSEQ